MVFSAASRDKFNNRKLKKSTNQLPGEEVHGGELSIVWLSDVHIERLALINVGTAVSSHLQNALLRNFPHRPVQVFEILRNSLNVL